MSSHANNSQIMKKRLRNRSHPPQNNPWATTNDLVTPPREPLPPDGIELHASFGVHCVILVEIATGNDFPSEVFYRDWIKDSLPLSLFRLFLFVFPIQLLSSNQNSERYTKANPNQRLIFKTLGYSTLAQRTQLSLHSASKGAWQPLSSSDQQLHI